jgi:hypothetical protein
LLALLLASEEWDNISPTEENNFCSEVVKGGTKSNKLISPHPPPNSSQWKQQASLPEGKHVGLAKGSGVLS